MTLHELTRRSVLVAAIVTAGCKVGPDYKRPSTDVADRWLDDKHATTVPTADLIEWWKTFQDPVLTELIEKSLKQNLTLRQAGLRVIQSRALRGVAVGQFFPQSQAAVGQAANNRASVNAPRGVGDRSFSDYPVGMQAAWELDFWGRFRRGIESADASLEAAVADYDAALVVLTGDVAFNYVQVRSLQEQLAYTQANVASQKDTLSLTRVRLEAGAVSELDVSLANATLANTESLVPQLEDSLRQAKLTLCVLLGRTPSDLASELGPNRSVPIAPKTIASGVPADLLRRRPEIRRAERLAAAASEQIGVATADLYPSISILGATGFHTSTYETVGRSPNPQNLFDANSFEGFVGLDFNWKVLNYGRVQNTVRFSDARFQEAAVAYQEAVLQAAREVEAGLSTFLRSGEQATFLSESVDSAQRTVDLSLLQYRQGAIDFLRVNQAQVDLVERQNRLVVARAGVVQGAIATYRALGGGWETRAGHEFVPQQTIDEMRHRTDWGDVLSPDYDHRRDVLLARPRRDVPAATTQHAGGPE